MDISCLPKTKRLYYDEHLYDFGAIVTRVEDEEVVLDQTAFFPRGGGQEPDHGTIDERIVYDVKSQEGVIIHMIREPNFKAGDAVKCKISRSRREQIMKHHTATHIIDMSARIILGKHVWQAGSEKDEDKAHLDITHPQPLTEEQIRSIESMANDIIKRNEKVTKELMPKEEAERKYGSVIYQGGPIEESVLRIISIPGIESEACGGLHVDRTGEVEEIFIISSKKIRSGAIRLEFVAGKRLVGETKERIANEKKNSQESYEKKMAAMREEKEKIKSLKGNSQRLFGINYVDTVDLRELQVIGRESVKQEPDNFSVLIGNGVVFGIRGARSQENIENTVLEAAKLMGGSASSSGNEAKGGGKFKDRGKEIYDKLKL
jgi:alanyl-tRNA synthetase